MSFGTTRAAVSTAIVRITRLETAPNLYINASRCINPQLGQLGDSGKTYCRWQRHMQSYRRPTGVGAENTRPCLLRTAARIPRVATTTTAATTTGTPSLARLTMVPHNFNTTTEEALKAVVQRPTHKRCSSPRKACPQRLPSAPKSQVCATGPSPTITPTDAGRGVSAPTDYPTAVRLNFPPLRLHSREAHQAHAPTDAPPAQALLICRENQVRGSLLVPAKTVA